MQQTEVGPRPQGVLSGGGASHDEGAVVAIRGLDSGFIVFVQPVQVHGHRVVIQLWGEKYPM